MERSDIRVLGAASRATRLLSAAFLIAAFLVAGGGSIVAEDMVLKRILC